eukprot:415051-Pelagomonas_calceolata.AAC.2
MDVDCVLHTLSGHQCPVILNMALTCQTFYILDVVSADRLAQHDLHITEQVSNRVTPPYPFDPSIPDQARCTSSRPDAIL